MDYWPTLQLYLGPFALLSVLVIVLPRYRVVLTVLYVATLVAAGFTSGIPVWMRVTVWALALVAGPLLLWRRPKSNGGLTSRAMQ